MDELGSLTMSAKELNRLEILGRVLERRLTQAQAAEQLGLGVRQVERLCRKLRLDGRQGLVSKKRGRLSNRKLPAVLRDRALELVRLRYADFGPTLAAEKLDGCDHEWFEQRAPRCTLLVYVDNATSRLMELRFVQSESTFDYFEPTRSYLEHHGKPVAFYSDQASVFRVTHSQTRENGGVTQFGRALSELNIDIICANMPQAKGRVERADLTLQDRLVKELCLAGIDSMEAANAFAPAFIYSA